MGGVLLNEWIIEKSVRQCAINAFVRMEKNMLPKNRTISLRLVVSITITIGMLLLATIIMVQNFRSAVKNAMFATQITSRYVADTVNLSVRFPIAPAQIVLKILSHDTLSGATTLNDRLKRVPILSEVLKNNPLSRAIFIGYNTGEIFLLRRAKEKGTPFVDNTPDNAAFLAQSKSLQADGSMLSQIMFFDESLELIELYETIYNIDPREREWFQKAMASTGVEVTHPYIFYTTGDIGITLASKTSDGRGVLGIDITTNDISEVLASMRITTNTEMVLVDGLENIIAYHDLDALNLKSQTSNELPNLSRLNVSILQYLTNAIKKENEIAFFEHDGLGWYALRAPVTAISSNVFDLIIAIPARELLSEIWSSMYKQVAVALGVVIFLLLAGWNFGRWVMQPLHNLTEQVVAIGNFDFSNPIKNKSILKEVRSLGDALTTMTTTIRGFLQIALTLNKEQDLERMLAKILQELLDLVSSGAGAIYLYNDREAKLEIASSAQSNYPKEISLYVATLTDVELNGTVGKEMPTGEVVIALRNRAEELIGCFCLAEPKGENAKDETALRSFVEKISKSAAVAIETRQLIHAQKALLDAIITLIANAIDTKSKYTGGHCQRVPVIAQMLLEEVNKSTEPVFATSKMNAVDQEEFRIAAWLHDCGKITTPEHVVDKATKLEMIYNRIHEIRMRFEVMHRDLELACLESIASGANADEAKAKCQEEQAKLQEEFAFIAKCNIGGEFMRDEDVARLTQVATRTWLRHFDDTLGLSYEEARRAEQGVVLPVQEHLLDDKKEHKIDWNDDSPPVGADDPRNIWGFDMRAPALRANYGEVYNLGIRRGTLNDEERFKINDHIVQTIRMLTSLPFPKSMSRVPRIAGSHHEKIDGTGYPRKFSGSEMSFSEKILAVADVFEALTAADRPYKSGKKLSQCLGIMAKMVQEKHLDPDIFNLLLTSGVYMEYAKANVGESQIDEIKIEDFLVK